MATSDLTAAAMTAAGACSSAAALVGEEFPAEAADSAPLPGHAVAAKRSGTGRSSIGKGMMATACCGSGDHAGEPISQTSSSQLWLMGAGCVPAATPRAAGCQGHAQERHVSPVPPHWALSGLRTSVVLVPATATRLHSSRLRDTQRRCFCTVGSRYFVADGLEALALSKLSSNTSSSLDRLFKSGRARMQ